MNTDTDHDPLFLLFFWGYHWKSILINPISINEYKLNFYFLLLITTNVKMEKFDLNGWEIWWRYMKKLGG